MNYGLIHWSNSIVFGLLVLVGTGEGKYTSETVSIYINCPYFFSYEYGKWKPYLIFSTMVISCLYQPEMKIGPDLLS